MKIEREHVVDEIIGDVKTNKFKIGEDSMGIIIDSLINLYSDPIGSIVREVTSNCYDAHREKDLKIKHVIPMTAEDEPEWFHPASKKPQIEFQEENILLGIGNAFLFRDFGVGLSKKRVEEIYTLFGNSTKRDNNHQIGGFGIGAKSPFSYTDTFYIISNHNGKMFSYMLYRGNDAFHMDLLKQGETTELNSTEVIIPINKEESYRDIRNFAKAINSQLSYFIGLEFINVTEGTGRNVGTVQIDYEDDDIAICVDETATRRYDVDEIHLMVGRVRYPLNQDMVDSKINWGSSNIPVALKFDVGQLDLVPSREAIRYTDKTKAAITQKILDVQKRMKELCEKQLAECSNVIDWLAQATALTNNDSHYGRTYDSVFSVQSYLAKMQNKNAQCTLHGVELSGSLLNDTYRQSRLFRGFSAMTVTQRSDGNYIGGYKLVKSQVKTSDLINYPVFYQKQSDPDSEETRKVFLKSKDFYLARTHDTFVQIRENWAITDNDILKESEIDMWNARADAREEDVIRSDFKNMKILFNNCKFNDYDNVDMSKADTELGEEIGEYETEAERRKRMGKAFLRRIYFYDSYQDPNKVKFSNDEYHISDLVTYQEEGGIVIYGNSIDTKLLKNVAAMYHQAGFYEEAHFYSSSSLETKIHPVIILKVAATLNKQLTQFINVNDLAPMKNPVLTNWYTAKTTRESTDNLYFFSCFEKLNSDLYYKWKRLKENHENNFKHFSYIHRSDENEMMELCKKNDCVHHTMLEDLKELESYSVNLDMLKHLDFSQLTTSSKSEIPSKEVFLALREYLRFKKKAVVKFKKQKKKEVKDLVI